MGPLENLVCWYETLTPQTLARISEIYAEDAFFRDPFNAVRGPQAIAGIFAHMFATTEHPRFVVTATFPAGDRAMLLWRFEFGMNGKPMTIEGASEVRFNPEGRVILHRDYWDSSAELLQKLPAIGSVFRWLACRFSALR